MLNKFTWITEYSMPMVPNPTTCRAFILEEIAAATENFSRKIGQGGFGSVFFGKLPEGKEIAVKVPSSFSRQGIHEFMNEVSLRSLKYVIRFNFCMCLL